MIERDNLLIFVTKLDQPYFVKGFSVIAITHTSYSSHFPDVP